MKSQSVQGRPKHAVMLFAFASAGVRSCFGAPGSGRVSCILVCVTPSDLPVWINAGVKPDILMGGVSTENGSVQTSLADTRTWTQYALQHGLRGMFSWRLDNDHGTHGTDEDVDPTFTGAKTIYDTVMGN